MPDFETSAGIVFGDSGSVNAPSTDTGSNEGFSQEIATPDVDTQPQETSTTTPNTDAGTQVPDAAAQAAAQAQQAQAAQAQQEQLRQYVQQLQQREQSLNLERFQVKLAQMPEEQRTAAIQQFQFQQQQMQLQQAAQAQQQQMQSLEPVFREMTIRDLVSEYAYAGVSREMLGRFNDPDSMEAFCKVMGDQRRAAKAQAAQAPAKAAVKGTGAGTAPPRNWMSTPLSQLAAEAFGS